MEPMEKRIDEMTADELSREEYAMLDKISAANREAQAGLSRIRDIHHERFAREVQKLRRRKS